MLHFNDAYTQHALVTHSISCILLIPDVPAGVSATVKHSRLKRENAARVILPSAPPWFLNLASLCFRFKGLHWTFAWPDVSSPRCSTTPVGRMERMPWQPAIPNGLCSSALRSTVKGRELTYQECSAPLPLLLTEPQRSWIWADAISWHSTLIACIQNARHRSVFSSILPRGVFMRWEMHRGETWGLKEGDLSGRQGFYSA